MYMHLYIRMALSYFKKEGQGNCSRLQKIKEIWPKKRYDTKYNVWSLIGSWIENKTAIKDMLETIRTFEYRLDIR